MKNLLPVLALCFLCSLKFNPAFAREGSLSDTTEQPDEEMEQEKVVQIDEIGLRVTISGFLNTRYFRAPHTSAVVFREGFNAKRGLFISSANPVELYDALIQIGAIPAIGPSTEKRESFQNGNEEEVEPDSHSGGGTSLEIFFTWEEADREFPLHEIISPYPRQLYDIRFIGNRDNIKSVGSGDLLCLDNCSIGITGNIAIEKRGKRTAKVSFNANKRDLPPNGHGVRIIFQLRRDEGPPL